MFNITFYLCASLIMIMKTNPLDCFTITKKKQTKSNDNKTTDQFINFTLSSLSKKLYRTQKI